MKKSIIISLLTVAGLALSGVGHAGNLPNTAHTMTGGIGSGTTHGRIPATHPATKSRAASHRNSYAADYTAYYRQGTTHQPSTPGSSTGSRPESFPGRGVQHMNATAAERTAGKLPQFDSFPPSGNSNPGAGMNPGRPSSASAGIPSSVSAGIPDRVTTGIPATTPPVSTGQPAAIPALPAFPDAATNHRAAAANAAADGLARRGGGRP
jgi:hypothetical protein